MQVRNKWSKHAKQQRAAILRTIARELSREDASRWNGKIADAVTNLPDFPELGDAVPAECFFTIPADFERLRQTHCLPYRIIYEYVGGEIHILAIMHSSAMIRTRDTYWN